MEELRRFSCYARSIPVRSGRQSMPERGIQTLFMRVPSDVIFLYGHHLVDPIVVQQAKRGRLGASPVV